MVFSAEIGNESKPPHPRRYSVESESRRWSYWSGFSQGVLEFTRCNGQLLQWNSIYFNRPTGQSATTKMTAPVISTIVALSECGNRKIASADLPPLAVVAEANAASL